MTKVVTNFSDFFSGSPEPQTRIPNLGSSPIILPDDEVSRDSGIFMSDGSNSTSPVSYSKTPVGKQLSFRSFFTSPDATPKATEFCKTRRTLFADDDNISTASPNFGATTVTPIVPRNKGAKRRLCIHEENHLSPYKPNKKVKVDSVHVHDSIKAALNKENSCEDLTGDFSRSHRLPIVPGKHQDLKSISPDTVADLISGNMSLQAQFQIIDCRYPYEYKGGHIKGAMNLHTQDEIKNLLENKFNDPASKNNILLFHCEFSSERGPKRARFLRSQDRQLNAESYPSLCFPEIYIMDGGYKAFYEQHSELCTPEGYTPMLQAEHREDMKKFRSKSKSWTAGEKRANNYKRSKLSRLQLEY